MACPALVGRGYDHWIMTCKYSCLNFLLHLPGVFGFGLLHYEDGVMGRRASSAEALVAKWGAL